MKTVVDVIFNTVGGEKLRKVNDQLGRTQSVVQKTNGKLGQAAKGFRGVGAAGSKAAAGVSMFGNAVKSALGPIGAALAAVAGLGAAFKAIADQDFAVAKVKSLGVNAGELNEELKRVSGELNNSASVAQLTASAYDVASAGFTDAADAAQVLKAASMGATGGFTDMNTAGDALTSVLNAYGMSADQATAIMDKFIQTQNDGKIVVDEYARNIGKVAAAAAGLGIPLDEVNAAIAQSTASGVKAEVAFTGVKAALARLASGEAANALKGTGLEIDAASVKADGLIGTLKKMNAAGLDTGQIFKALGTEAAPALLPLLNNLEKTEQLLQRQRDSAGATGKAHKLATDTIKGAWKQLTNVFSNFFTDQTAAGEALKLVLQGLAVAIDNILKAVNLALTPFKVLVGIIKGAVEMAGKLGEGFKAAFDSPEGRAFLQVVELIRQKIAEATKWVGENFKMAWDAVLGVVVEVGKFLGTTLLTAIDGVASGLAATFGWLPMIGDKVKGMKKAWDGFKKKIEETEAPAQSIKESTDEIEEGLEAAKQVAVEFAEAQKSVADESVAAAEASQKILKDNQSLYQAEHDMKKAINDIAIENAKIALEQAKNMQQVVDAAETIFHVTEAQAGLDRDLAKFKADAAVNELRLKEQLLTATLAQVEAEKAIVAAKGESTKAIDAQIAKTHEGLKALQGSIAVQERIKQMQYDQADAIYKQTVAMARLTAEQNIKTGKEKLSVELNKQIEASKRAQTAEMQKQNQVQGQINQKEAESAKRTRTVTSQMTAITKQLEDEFRKKSFEQKTGMSGEYLDLVRQQQRFRNEIKRKSVKNLRGEIMNKQMIDSLNRGLGLTSKKMTEIANQAGVARNEVAQIVRFGRNSLIGSNTASRSTGPVNSNTAHRVNPLPRYASGGYVNGAQTALIGEAGPEYVIPANRMDSALANYAAGKRGNAVLSQQVNVTTGPVQQMDGTNYVTLQQATSMSQSAARQGAQMALTQIKTDPGTRRAIGVGS